MILQQASKPVVASHLVLQGVPRVGFYMGGERCPEDVPFPACLRACLDFFGEDLGFRLISAHDTTWRLDNTYTFLMAVSGCAFRLTWKPGWHEDNVAYTPEARAFEAAGYELKIIESTGDPGDEPLLREAILHSLQEKGRPVLAFGVIGPPEACLITGYDEQGEVLIGWNFFQDFPEFNAGIEWEPTGEFRKRDWFSGTRSLLLFGDKKSTPPFRTVCGQALRWALDIMRAPVGAGALQDAEKYSGFAAYQTWASQLINDQDFPEDMEVLRQRFLVHDDAVGMVAEGRWYAARFMEWLADIEPALEEVLLAAAACFEREHDLMWQIWGLSGGNGRSDEHVRKLADPAVRRAIVPLILQAMQNDIEAAGYIERALVEE